MRDLLAALTPMLVASLIASAAAAHDPGRPGPYEVGFTSFVPIDTRRSTDSRFGGRPMAIGVFYPVDPEDVDASSPRALCPRNPVNAPSSTSSSMRRPPTSGATRTSVASTCPDRRSSLTGASSAHALAGHGLARVALRSAGRRTR